MNWLKYKKIFFAISISLIAIGTLSLLKWGLNLGVDFTGGAIIEYRIEKQISTEELRDKLSAKGLEVSSIQETSQGSFLFRFGPIDESEKTEVGEKIIEIVGEAEELRFENVGPAIGPELVKKTIYAILIASGAILIWVAIQFKEAKFGVSAILAMFHDSFVLLGLFSLLGHFGQAEVDFLFVTALLTTLSFSVHDTIVVFDRIREIRNKEGGDLVRIANQALTETMVRSLNNSFTIVFMLVALILLGGSTVKWFAAALLIGTLLGTYSSPFVAVPLLVSWDDFVKRFKRK